MTVQRTTPSLEGEEEIFPRKIAHKKVFPEKITPGKTTPGKVSDWKSVL